MEDLPSSEPDFRVNSPTSNLFVAAGPIDVVRSDDRFGLTWRQPDYQMQSEVGESFLADAVARSGRDVEKHPDSPRARTNFGVALMNAGQLDRAIVEFESALAIDATHYSALAHLMTARFRRGEVEQAESLANVLRQQFPTDTVGPIMLACIAMRRGQSQRAVAKLEDAVRLDRKSPLPRYLLGLASLERQQERKAIAHLKAATRLDPHSPLFQTGLGVAYAVHGDLRRSVRAFRTSLALDPNALESVCGLAKILIEQGSAESAIQLLSDYLASHGNERVVRELLAQAYRTQQQFRLAQSHLLAALTSLGNDESPEAVLERARLMNNVGVKCFLREDLGAARKWFKQSLDLVPHRTAFQNLHETNLQLNDVSSARSLLDEWFEKCPEDDDVRVLIAVNRGEGGDRQRGIRELRELIERGVATPQAYGGLGALLSDDERSLGQALTVLREARDRFPEETGILNNLAYVHLMRGEPSDARRLLESIRADDRKNSVFLTATWGLLLLWEGDLAGAVEFYESAARLASSLGKRNLSRTARQKMHLELARHFLREGDRQEAGKEVERGLLIHFSSKYEKQLRDMQENLRSA